MAGGAVGAGVGGCEAAGAVVSVAGGSLGAAADAASDAVGCGEAVGASAIWDAPGEVTGRSKPPRTSRNPIDIEAAATSNRADAITGVDGVLRGGAAARVSAATRAPRR